MWASWLGVWVWVAREEPLDRAVPAVAIGTSGEQHVEPAGVLLSKMRSEMRARCDPLVVQCIFAFLIPSRMYLE